MFRSSKSRKSKVFSVFLTLLFMNLVGCGLLGYQYQPQVVTPPQIEAVESISKIILPELHGEESKTFEIGFQSEISEPIKNKDFTGNVITGNKGAKPSVLIGLPADDNDLEAEHEQKEYNLFATKGYFNTREQLIEKALIFQGFDVRDRSKFEAILRDLRDKANPNKYYWTNTRDQLTPGAQSLFDMLVARLKNKEISEAEYTKKIDEIMSDGTNIDNSHGKNRGKDGKEMTDTSEMIRAASGRADFLLLVNEFKINPIRDAKFDFTKNNEFEEARQSLKNSIPFEEYKELQTSVTAPGYTAKFTAKLINVTTGSIEWIGSFEVSSSDIHKFDAEFSYDKVIANKNLLLSNLSTFNAKLTSKYDALKKAEREYDYAYRRLNEPKEFDSESSMNFHASNVVNSYSGAGITYKNALANYKELENEKLKLESNLNWIYDYQFHDPIIRPDISKLNNKENAADFEDHVRKLLSTVISSLIRTIDVNKA